MSAEEKAILSELRIILEETLAILEVEGKTAVMESPAAIPTRDPRETVTANVTKNRGRLHGKTN